MSSEKFNIGAIEFDSTIYGPGKRTVIWFQGCTLGCKGCWNTQFQSHDPNKLYDRQDLLKLILEKNSPVTFLGGEPLQQIENLTWLVDNLAERSIHIMLYTGYELDEIERDLRKSHVCNLVNILVPGRYMENQRDINLAWRGSKNQPVIIRDSSKKEDDKNQVEITLGHDGNITCLGYPSDGLRAFMETLDHHKTNDPQD